MGLSAAAIQAYFEVQPPVAYGISFVGHPNDLLIWITNNFSWTEWPQREVFAVYPILTVVGLFLCFLRGLSLSTVRDGCPG